MYPNCIISKGLIYALITDYKNELYFRVPNPLIDAIKDLSENDFDDLLSKNNDPELSKKVCDLKDWLIGNNLGMMASVPHIFPTLKSNFKFSSLSNAVIEVTESVVQQT